MALLEDEERYEVEKAKFDLEVDFLNEKKYIKYEKNWILNANLNNPNGLNYIYNEELLLLRTELKSIFLSQQTSGNLTKEFFPKFESTAQGQKFLSTLKTSEQKYGKLKFPSFLFDSLDISLFRECIELFINKWPNISINAIEGHYKSRKDEIRKDSSKWIIKENFSQTKSRLSLIMRGALNFEADKIVGVIAYPTTQGKDRIQITVIVNDDISFGPVPSIVLDGIHFSIRKHSINNYNNATKDNLFDLAALFNGIIIYDTDYKLEKIRLSYLLDEKLAPFIRDKVRLGYKITDTLELVVEECVKEKGMRL